MSRQIKIAFFILVLLTVHCALKAQWTVLNSGTDKSLRTVYFLDNETGFVAGESRMILKTTDGGQTWDTVNYQFPSNGINKITFCSTEIGFAGGFNATLLKTIDGGETWFNSNNGLPANEEVASVCFIDCLIGYAGLVNVGTGNSLYKTTDGGDSWVNAGATIINGATSIWFTTDSIGFVTLGDLFKTTDAGNSWNLYVIPDMYYNSQYYFNSLVGFAAGIGHEDSNYGIISKTINGGEDWILQTFPLFHQLTDIYFANTQVGFAVGLAETNDAKYILRTTNAGESWETHEVPGIPFTYFYSMHCPSDSLCYIVGDSGEIIKTENLGGGVSVAELEMNSNLIIYPNPATNLLTIKTTAVGKAEYFIYDINGRKLDQWSMVNGQFVIDVSTFAEGLYLLQIQTEQGSINRKFVKRK